MTWRDDRRLCLADPIMGGRAEEAQPKRGSSAAHAKKFDLTRTLCVRVLVSTSGTLPVASAMAMPYMMVPGLGPDPSYPVP